MNTKTTARKNIILGVAPRTPEQKELIRKASAYLMEKNKEIYKRLANR